VALTPWNSTDMPGCTMARAWRAADSWYTRQMAASEEADAL
jgi:hypothetical protein